MIRPRAVGAARKAPPKKSAVKKAGVSGATGRAPTARTKTRRLKIPTSARNGLGLGDWLKLAGVVGTLAGALIGYGQTQAKVDALVKEQERQGKVLQNVYDHVAFGQGGTAGPAPPLPAK